MDQYHIYDCVGRGKHSVVFKGRKKKALLYYAIKKVDKEQRKRVEQEVKTMNRLIHKNVLRFYTWFETSRHLWLILEYCVGGDLATLLEKDKKLPEASIHDFARDLMVAMQYMHANGIIYCDLKPSNIMLDENGRLKLGGFGLTRTLDDINQHPMAGLPPAKRGTPCYMAPELFCEGATHSSASDLWAAGCVLYECFQGHVPFTNPSLKGLIDDLATKQLEPLQGATPEFADLVMRLLTKDPAKRITWQDVTQHHFWKSPLVKLPLPEESVFQQFLQHYNVLAVREPTQRFNSLRFSQVVRSNIEQDGGKTTEKYAAITPDGAPEDVQINNPDAELDFEDRAEPPASPASHHASNLSYDSSAVSTAQGTSGAPSQGYLSSGSHGQKRPSVGSAGQGGSSSGAYSSPARHPRTMLNSTARIEQPTPMHVQRDRRAGSVTEHATIVAPHAVASKPASRPEGVAAVMWHPSDGAVKPIVGNAKIERQTEPVWDPALLPFKALSKAEVLQLPEREHMVFSHTVCTAITAPAMQYRGKINALSYLESLCHDSQCAQLLLTGPVPKTLLSLLNHAAHPTSHRAAGKQAAAGSLTADQVVQLHCLSTLGLMTRYSSELPDDLGAAGLLHTLHHGLLQPNSSARLCRAYAATFGEVFFYIASMEDKLSSCWQLPLQLSDSLTSLLLGPTDIAVKLYLMKAIENIAAHPSAWTTRLAAPALTKALAALWRPAVLPRFASPGQYMQQTDGRPRDDPALTRALQVSAACTLCRLMRQVPEQLPRLLDDLGLEPIVSGLQQIPQDDQVDGKLTRAPKILIASLNMLLCFLSQPNATSQSVQHFLHGMPGFAQLLCKLTTVDDAIVKAKAAAAALLMVKGNLTWMVDLCSSKLLSQLERLARDKDPFLCQVMVAVQSELAAMVVPIIENLERSLCVAPGTPHATDKGAPASQLLVLIHCLNNQWLRDTALRPELIHGLAKCCHLLGTLQVKDRDTLHMQELMLHLIESLFHQQDKLPTLCQPTLAHLVPSLTLLTSSLMRMGPQAGAAAGDGGAPKGGASQQDIATTAVKVLTDLMVQVLWDTRCCYHVEAVQDPAVEEEEELGMYNDLIDEVVEQHILSLVPELLQGPAPWPLCCLKLLSPLLDNVPHWAAPVAGLGVWPALLEYLSLDSQNNTVHLLRVCRSLMLNGCAPAAELRQAMIAEKVLRILEHVASTGTDQFLEPALELHAALVMLDSNCRKEGDAAAVGAEQLRHSLPLLLQVCCHEDGNMARLAAEVISSFVEVHPRAAAHTLLQPQGLQSIALTLQHVHEDADAQADVLYHILASLATMVTEADDQDVHLAKLALQPLDYVLQAAAAGGDQPVQELAVELQKLMSDM